jgi:hypothetical protein
MSGMSRLRRSVSAAVLAAFFAAVLLAAPVNVQPLRAHEPVRQSLRLAADGSIVRQVRQPIIRHASELPEFDQEEVLRGQRDRLEGISQALRLRLHASESRHYLLFSDLDSRVRNAILVWLEDFHAKILRSFHLTAADRLWDGKCLVLVFSRHEDLARYAQMFDNHNLGRSRGYFMLEARMSDGPRLVHIATYQSKDDGNRGLREVLVHEATHAVVELYGKSGELPLWLHEGLAEFMVVTVDPTQRPVRQERAFARASATPYAGIGDLFTKKFLPSDLEDYAVRFSLVDYLHRRDGGALRTLIDNLKAGMNQEQALAESYGLTLEEIDQQWRGYVLRLYRPAEGR